MYLVGPRVLPALYRKLGLEVEPLFAEDSVVLLQWADGGWMSKG